MAKKRFSEFYIKERNEDRHFELSISPWGIQYIHNIDNPIRMNIPKEEVKDLMNLPKEKYKEIEKYCEGEMKEKYLAELEKISDSYISMVEAKMQKIKEEMFAKVKEM